MLLEIANLRTHFLTRAGRVPAVEGVCLDVERGETVALVGESGCGKSVTALSMLRLLPASARIEGRIVFDGRDLLALPEREMRDVRGRRIAMIFQQPTSCLNPLMPVGRQIVESVRNKALSRPVSPSRERPEQVAVALLRRVGIPAPEQRSHDYPHQLSGGMLQRVMIAAALAGRPELLIADEPTTALDVTVQAQILELLREIQQRDGLAILLITHDLGVVAQTADRVSVMYAGRIVESGPAGEVLRAPRHPYTQGLLRCTPRLTDAAQGLAAIPGETPDPRSRPKGCPFHPRCELGRDDARCRADDPPLEPLDAGVCCACWKAPGYPAA